MKQERVDLQKEVFNKQEYTQTINTDFTELGVTTAQDDLENQVTVEDFFTSYDELFYDIPAVGSTNSHEYLIRTSGEYVDFDVNQEEIDALRVEIANLRTENLELQQENANLLLSSSAA